MVQLKITFYILAYVRGSCPEIRFPQNDFVAEQFPS